MEFLYMQLPLGLEQFTTANFTNQMQEVDAQQGPNYNQRDEGFNTYIST